MTVPVPPSGAAPIPPSASPPVGDVVTHHDCGHACCDERTDPLHDHFLRPVDCPRCQKAAASLETALADHFYRAACRWAELDGEPAEALVRDRFLVAAQDAVAALGLSCAGRTS